MKINADLLIQLRKDRGWTQEELAKTAGLNIRTIQRIEKEMLAFIDERKTGLRPNIRSRIETRWVTPDDPGLKNGEADMALMVNTYSNIAERIEYLRKLRVGLADNGQVVIVDFKLGDLPTGPPDSLKVSPVLAMQELTEAGFSNTTIDSTSLVYQYLIISNK